MHRLLAIVATAAVLAAPAADARAQPGEAAVALPIHGGVVPHSLVKHVIVRARRGTFRGRLRVRLPKPVVHVLSSAKQHGASFLSSLGKLVDTTKRRVTAMKTALVRRRPTHETVVHQSTPTRVTTRLRGLDVLARVQREVPGLLPEHGRTLQPLGPDGVLSVMPGGFARLERAVEAMHMAGIAHGNISLANLRVDEFGQLYLVGGWHGARSQATDTELLADKIGLASVRSAFAGSAN